MLEKVISYKHGVTELGNLQVYQVDTILEDGKIIDSRISKAYTPKDTSNMDGFDDKSKDIVEVITDQKVKDDFETEKQKITGVGIEKAISHDRTIEGDNKIAVRRITRIFNNGKELFKKYHRSWIMPGENPEGNDVISKELAKKLHTQEVIDAYTAKKEKYANSYPGPRTL